MKKIKHKRPVVIALIVAILLLAYALAKPHVNRLLDNRERAIMTRHGILIEKAVQTFGRQNGAYPTLTETRQLINSSGLISPHTKLPYVLVENFTDISQLDDSQIAYGLGEYKSDVIDDKKAYVCIGINLPRTREGGADCVNLELSKETDARIKYNLSCSTNFFGFSTGCDKSIILSL